MMELKRLHSDGIKKKFNGDTKNITKYMLLICQVLECLEI